MTRQLPQLVVDGYNILLALARGEGLRPDEVELPAARRRLADLLAEWADAREQEVTLVWDGGAVSRPAAGLLREVAVQKPAEADDWIVERVRALRHEGRLVTVATADRGIHRRLPRGTPLADLARLAADLLALADDPLSLPGIGGGGLEGELPATDAVVDTRRLPRRRRSPPLEPPLRQPAPPPPAAPRRAGGGDRVDENERRAREAAREKKRRRRERYLRARSRSRGKK